MLNQLVLNWVSLWDILANVCVYLRVFAAVSVSVCPISLVGHTPVKIAWLESSESVPPWPQSWLLIWDRPLECGRLYQSCSKQQACRQLLWNHTAFMDRSPLCPLSHSAWLLVIQEAKVWCYLTGDHTHSLLLCTLSLQQNCQSACLTGTCGASWWVSMCLVSSCCSLTKVRAPSSHFFPIWFQIWIHVISATPVFNQMQRSILAAASRLLNCSSSLVAQTIISCIIRYRAGHIHQHVFIPQESTCSVS